MKAMWKFSALMAICLSLFVGYTKSELMCHQKGDYCENKEPVVDVIPGNLLENLI